ncbi:MAG: hypothetical protein ACO3A2_10245 [Bdellovibrionia bacterium]
MFKKIWAPILMVGCVLGLNSGSAQAGSVGVDLVANGSYTMATGTANPTAAMGYPGGGLNLNFNFNDKVAFQLGGHYVTRNYTGGTEGNVTENFVSGVGGFKFSLAPAFAINLGGYYNYGLTTVATGTDYGVAAGISLIVPMGKGIGFLINPMYHYALSTKTFSSGSTVVPSELLAFVGFTIGGGK